MATLAQIILGQYNASQQENTLLVPIIPGGVLQWDANSNPLVAPLTPSQVSGLTNLLNLMTLGGVQNLFQMTALTGGTTTNLDAFATANGAQAVGALVCLEVSGGQLSFYRLTAGTTATSAPNSIRPLDYNAVTNQVYWQLTPVLGASLLNAPQWQPTITATSGAGAAGLDQVATVGLSVSPASTVYAFVNSATGGLQIWNLVAGTSATGTGVQRPADYNASTNAKIWIQIG